MAETVESGGVDAASERIAAVLFDIDGTLIDSNYLHVDSWSRAFHDVGLGVNESDIHHRIGMDSGQLLSALIGDDDAERLGDEIKRLHARYYAASAPRLRVFDGARELLAELDRRGITVVLATSAPEDELAMLREVLESEDPITAMTSSEDVETAKPDPHVVEIALQRAGTTANNALFVGDSIWDVQSAAAAGVATIGVLTGGSTAADLTEAGAVAVYDDVAALLAGLDDSAVAALFS